MEMKGSVVVYCIAILTDQEQEGQKSAEYIRNYCTEKRVFPPVSYTHLTLPTNSLV